MFKRKKIRWKGIFVIMGIAVLLSTFLSTTPVDANVRHPVTTVGVQLRYNTWYYMRNDNFPDRGGLYSRGNNGWAAQRLRLSANANIPTGERIRFINPNHQNSTALINWNAPVRIQRASGGFLGRHWQGGTNWFVFNRTFARGSDFNLRLRNGSVAISYAGAWQDYDFINADGRGYLYLRHNVAHTWNFEADADNGGGNVAHAHVDINGEPLRFNQRYYVQLASGLRANFLGYWNWDYIRMQTNRATAVVFAPQPGNTTMTRVINPLERVYIRNTRSRWNGFYYWNPSNTNMGGIHLTDARRARPFIFNDRRTQQPRTHHTIRNVATGRHAEMANESFGGISWLNSGNAVTNNENQHFIFIPAN